MPRTLGKSDSVRLKLQLLAKVSESQTLLRKRHPESVDFLKKLGVEPGKIRDHAARVAATGALASALMLAGPLANKVGGSPLSYVAEASTGQLREALKKQLALILPAAVGPISKAEEEAVSKVVFNVWGIKARATLEGNKLNKSYGFIGAEQHLPRFPGDTVYEHNEFQNEGITSGLGAWGYFANSKDELTNDLILKEKYYVAVQTLYLPDWEKRLSYLRGWYKYRKVLVVNPVNGKTVVADVADSGPADWTGKQFGGSPEVMAYLGLNVGMQKGAALLFFVDDPAGEIPLGPVEYNVITGPVRAVNQ